MLPLAVLAWEAFWNVTLISPWVASEARKALMVRNWTLVWDAIRSTPDTSPPNPVGYGIAQFPSLLPAMQLTRWCSGKESACKWRKHKRHGFDPWIGKIPWGRKR